MTAIPPGPPADEDKTVIEESYLGPTQPYAGSPAPLVPRHPRTPSPQKMLLQPPVSATSSDRYYVESVVSVEGEDEEDLHYDSEKLWWETWRKAEVLKIEAKVKALEKERKKLEALEFPINEEYYRNRELVLAAEQGLQKYNNGDPFKHVENQLIGRELSNAVPKAISIAAKHPATRVVRVSPSKRKEPYRNHWKLK